MAVNYHEWAFTSEQVVSLLGYSVPAKEHAYYPCPFCKLGKNRKPLNINFRKNVYRCNKNPEHSGNIVQFYAQVRNLDYKEAYQEIIDQLGIDNFQPATQIQIPEQKEEQEEQPLDADKLNKAYRKFLSHLKLSSKHYADLLHRGFSKDDILTRVKYKTLPYFDKLEAYEFTKALGLSTDDLYGVPGFQLTKKKTSWTMNIWHGGICVPYYDFYNRIHGIQIRIDNEIIEAAEAKDEVLPKYHYFSSRYGESGTAAKGCVHYAGVFAKDADGIERFQIPKDGTLHLTEGAMKADLSFLLSGNSYIAIPGVYFLKILLDELPLLKQYGLKKIIIDYDMDRMMNIDVLVPLINMKKAIEKAGIICEIGKWNFRYYDCIGNACELDVNNDFVITVEKFDDYMERGVLEEILEKLCSIKHNNVFFALAGKEEATPTNFEKYQKAKEYCENKDIKCSLIYYQLRLKGIDNYYAYMKKGIM